MNESPPSEMTEILVQLQRQRTGDGSVTRRAFTLAYDELHLIASRLMRHERDEHTLEPTALVHEAFLRLVDASKIDWQGRAHFLGIAARAMRQILIQHARRRSAAKREGGWERVTLDDVIDRGRIPDVKILQFEQALEDFSSLDERAAKIVELRVFGGMTNREIAHVLDVSPRTVDGDWSVARMWLSRELAGGSS